MLSFPAENLSGLSQSLTKQKNGSQRDQGFLHHLEKAQEHIHLQEILLQNFTTHCRTYNLACQDREKQILN